MGVTGLDHVQLAIPAGGEAKARNFYMGLLSFDEERKPDRLMAGGGAWFVAGRAHLHIGIDPDFSPAKKAHPALLVDDLAALSTRLRAAGHAIEPDDRLPGYDRIFTYDPFGNRVELMQPR
ncbi:MAG: VOC family protein [Pacificimonas sp.]